MVDNYWVLRFKGSQMSSTAQKKYFSNSNDEVAELKKLLQNAPVQKNEGNNKKILQRVIAGMTLGMDMSPLFTEMIKVNNPSLSFVF